MEGSALEQIRHDDAFFCSLVNTIPAKFYFDQDTVKEIREKILETTETVLGKCRYCWSAFLVGF